MDAHESQQLPLFLPGPHTPEVPSGTEEQAKQSETKADLRALYAGSSLWAKFKAKNSRQPLPLLDPDEPLDLSPTSLDTYVKCPQQFFYKHLLYLRGPQAEAAIEGVGLHRFMEAFHQLPPAEQTQATLNTMVEALLENPPRLETLQLFDADYSENDVAFITDLDPIAQFDIRKRLRRAFDDLLDQGFAKEPPKQVLQEVPYRKVSIPGLDGATISARLDALIETASGDWNIVDYKFYQSGTKFGQLKEQSRNGQLAKVFTPLDSHATTHPERFGIPDNRNYQLPLAYLATQYAVPDNDASNNTSSTTNESGQDITPNLAGQVSMAALQLVRAPVLGKKGVGANRVALPQATLESGLSQLLADLNTYVVDPIRTQTMLTKNPEKNTCGYCSFLAICDASWEPAHGA